MANGRIIWVDMLKGFCILAILWFHTEMYYSGADIIPYSFYVGDVLATFFFLSGYTSYRESPLEVRKMLYGIFRWLLVPYFVFAVLLSLPKALVHHSFDGLGAIATNILTGQASWFISALVVARLLFVVVMYGFRSSPLALSVSAMIALLLAAVVGNRNSPLCYEFDLWYVNEGLLGFFFMAVGWFFHRNESWMKKHLLCLRGLAHIACLFLCSKYVLVHTDTQAVFGPIITSCFPLFTFDLIVSTFLLCGLFMLTPKVSFLIWIGRRSIVYYFVCGGCPLIASKVMGYVGFGYSSYLQIPIVFLLACLLATALAWIVYRYTNIVRPVK